MGVRLGAKGGMLYGVRYSLKFESHVAATVNATPCVWHIATDVSEEPTDSI